MSVTVKSHDHAAIVTMAWPERRNALGPSEAVELAETLREAGGTAGVTAVVLTGEGAFCAGGDLPAILSAIDGATPADVEHIVYGRFQQIARALRDCPLPTVAAVDGPAVGLGLDLALWCDRRFAGAGAQLKQGWARMGLIPGIGGAALLNRVAPGMLWELLGDRSGRLNVARAAAQGIVTQVDSALDAAIAYATALAPIGDEALRAYVELGRAALPDDDYLARCAHLQSLRLTSRDFADRVADSGLSARRG
jgi:enoyl-CoA hydratase/carnithine racemase